MKGDFEKTLKKYAKPQILIAEKTAKQGLVVAGIIYVFYVLINFSSYLMGNIEFFGQIFLEPLVISFFIFIIYTAGVGAARTYKVQRAQILEEDVFVKTAPTDCGKKEEGADAQAEMATLKRSVEQLAVEVAFLRQQIKI